MSQAINARRGYGEYNERHHPLVQLTERIPLRERFTSVSRHAVVFAERVIHPVPRPEVALAAGHAAVEVLQLEEANYDQAS